MARIDDCKIWLNSLIHCSFGHAAAHQRKQTSSFTRPGRTADHAEERGRGTRGRRAVGRAQRGRSGTSRAAEWVGSRSGGGEGGVERGRVVQGDRAHAAANQHGQGGAQPGVALTQRGLVVALLGRDEPLVQVQRHSADYQELPGNGSTYHVRFAFRLRDRRPQMRRREKNLETHEAIWVSVTQ